MMSRIGALAVCIAVAAAGCASGGAGQRRRAPAAATDQPLVVELEEMGRQFARGVQLLALARDRQCRQRRRSAACERLQRQLAELTEIAEQALPPGPPDRGAPRAGGGRRVLTIVPVVE
jgi:hypothetical protein